MQRSLRQRSAYPVLLALGALDAAAYSIIVPALPLVSARTGAGPALIGALVGAFPLGIVLGFPLAGRAVARRSIRTTLVGSLVLLGFGAIPFIVSGSLPAFFVGRFVMGLGSAGLWIAVTFQTLERWPGQEYVCMSRIFAAYSVGGLLGPALGAIGGVRLPFVLYVVLLIIAIPAVWLMPPPAERRTFRPDRSVLQLRGFWAASAGVLFAYLALGVSEGTLPLHFGQELGQAQIGMLYVGVSVIVATAAALAARFTPLAMVLLSTVFATLGLGLAGMSGAPTVWIAAMAILGVGVGLGTTGSTGVLLEAVPTGRIVTAMIIWSEIGIAGYLLGPLAGGLITERFGFTMLGIVPLVAGIGTVGMLKLARPRR